MVCFITNGVSPALAFGGSFGFAFSSYFNNGCVPIIREHDPISTVQAAKVAVSCQIAVVALKPARGVV